MKLLSRYWPLLGLLLGVSCTDDSPDGGDDPGVREEAAPPATGSRMSSSNPGPVAEPPEADDDELDFGGGQVTVDAPSPTSTVPDEDPVVPQDPLVACEVAKGSGELPLIDDFEDLDLAPIQHDGRLGSWYAYNSEDDAAHTLTIDEVDDSPGEQGYALHSSGGGYEWAGIGVGLRWDSTSDLGEPLNCLYDASAYDGVRFVARGADTPVRFTVSVPEIIAIEQGGTCDAAEEVCWSNHGVDLVLGPEWQEYRLPFEQMPQPSWGVQVGTLDPSRLRTLQFEIPPGVSFDLSIDEIGFYSESGEELPLDAGAAADESDAGVLTSPSDAGVDGGEPMDSGS